MRILRCKFCEKPCTLTTLDTSEIRFCPADREDAGWRQVNKTSAS